MKRQPVKERSGKKQQVTLTSRGQWTYIKHSGGRLFPLCSDYVLCAQDTLAPGTGLDLGLGGRLPVWSSGKTLGQGPSLTVNVDRELLTPALPIAY